MNTAIKISAIALVAIVMGLSAIAPVIPQAHAIPVNEKICAEIQGIIENIKAAGQNVPPELLKLLSDCEGIGK